MIKSWGVAFELFEVAVVGMNGTKELLRASESTREVVDVPLEGTAEGRRNGRKVSEK
jgi:hypothetical protein